MAASVAAALSRELWLLLRAGSRFTQAQRAIDSAQSPPRPDTARHRERVNRTLPILLERLKRSRQLMNRSLSAEHAREPRRHAIRSALEPVLGDLVKVAGRSTELGPDELSMPSNAELVQALDAHTNVIRVVRRQVHDLAITEATAMPIVPENAIAAALRQWPTMFDALIGLGRRPDTRPTTEVERTGRNRHVIGITDEPIDFALNWVHSRCVWNSDADGAELWDYVWQAADGGGVDPNLREVVVPQLRALDKPETRRAFWLDVLSRFPQVAAELLHNSRPVPKYEQTHASGRDGENSTQQSRKKKRRAYRRRPSDPRPLTAMQAEVVQLVGECKGNIAEVARRLGKHHSTVQEQYKAAMAKLGTKAVRPVTRRLPSDRRGQETVAEGDDRRRSRGVSAG